MTSDIKAVKKQLDPVQSLVDYVGDIKPYHSKIVEVLIEFVNEDLVELSVEETPEWTFDFVKKQDTLMVRTCFPGFDTHVFGGSTTHTIASPNVAKQVNDQYTYGFVQNGNEFVIPGNVQRTFRPDSNVTITAHINDLNNLYNITDAFLGTPPTAAFVVDQSNITLQTGDEFYVIGSVRQKLFTVSSVFTVGNNQTKILTDQSIAGIDVGKQLGLKRFKDETNSGDFRIINTFVRGGSIDSWPDIDDPTTFSLGEERHTIITVDHTFDIPSLSNNQYYIASATPETLDIKDVFGYSNARRGLTSSPDEGSNYLPITNVQTSSVDDNAPIPNTGKVTVSGNFQVSNLFNGDKIVINESTGNNGTYTITSITFDSQDNKTTFGVKELIDEPVVDGFVQVIVPANSFAIEGELEARFSQGTLFRVKGGNLEGVYTTYYSFSQGGMTRIRTVEPLFRAEQGSSVINTTEQNEFVVSGDNTRSFFEGRTFTVIGSDGNDGSYTVAAPGARFDPDVGTLIPVDPQETTIVTDDVNGRVISTSLGKIVDYLPGYGEISKLCNVVPETFIEMFISDFIRFDGLGIDLSDNIIAYNLENSDTWGFDLPLTTILSDTTPSIPEQGTPPTEEFGALWFDTSTKTFRRYRDQFWEPIVTAYWLDTSSSIFHYRTFNKNVDTGWVVMFDQSTQLSAVFPANSDKNTNAFANGFSIEPHIVFHQHVSVDETNDAYIIAGGNWAERLGVVSEIDQYSTAVGNLGSNVVQNFNIQHISTSDNSFTINSDKTWLFEPGRIMYVHRTRHGILPFTINSSTHDSIDNQTIVVVDEQINLQQPPLENPIPVNVIDSGNDTIELEGNVQDRYPTGTSIYIEESTTQNNGQWTVDEVTYNSGSNVTILQVVEDIPQDDSSGSATLQTVISQRFIDDYAVIYGAVYESILADTRPEYDTKQPKTVISMQQNVNPSTDAIAYRYVGPIRMDIAEYPHTTIKVDPNDNMYIEGEIFETISTFDITSTNKDTNTIDVEYTDPQTGIAVDLATKYTTGTVVSIHGSYGGEPSSLQTNDAKYIVKDSMFDSNTGITTITLEDRFDQIPPFKTVTVVEITNEADQYQTTITLDGDQTNIFDALSQSEQFVPSQPLFSTDDFNNVFTVVNTDYDKDNDQTTLFVAERVIDTNFTGPLDVIKTDFRANIFFDQTNTDSPWKDGQIQLGVTSIDEHHTKATIIDTISFGWGDTLYWKIVETNQASSSITIDGDQTSKLDQNDQVSIVGSDGNDGNYQINQASYDSSSDQTSITLFNPTIPTEPPDDLHGTLKIDSIDVTNWFQYLITETVSSSNTFKVFGNATQDIQSGQTISVFSTKNNGVYTVQTISYQSSTGLTEIVVDNNVNYNEVGGWIQSYRDTGMSLLFEDVIETAFAEEAEANVLTTAGALVGAWDYDMFDIGSFDESSSTVIHLYSNSF